MKLATLFTVGAIVSIGFAIPLLLVPGEFLPMYAVETTPGAVLLARLLGGAFTAIGVLTWLARPLPEESAGARVVVRALLVGNSIGFLVTLVSRLQGVGNALGWSSVVIYALLAGAYGMFAMRKPGDAATA